MFCSKQREICCTLAKGEIAKLLHGERRQGDKVGLAFSSCRPVDWCADVIPREATMAAVYLAGKPVAIFNGRHQCEVTDAEVQLSLQSGAEGLEYPAEKGQLVRAAGHRFLVWT